MAKYIKSILLSGMLICLWQPNLQAQLPSARYEGKEPLKTNLQMLRKQYNGISFAGGFQQRTNFLNPVFAANLGTSYEGLGGFYLGGRITFYPFFLDVVNSKDYFQVNNIPGITSGEQATHKGWDLSLSTALLPYGKLAKNLMPYAGIGYQVSELCVHCKQLENDPDDLDVPFNEVLTSSPFWKTGLAVSYKTFRIEGEFKQTVSLKNTHALNSWRVGLGWTPRYF